MNKTLFIAFGLLISYVGIGGMGMLYIVQYTSFSLYLFIGLVAIVLLILIGGIFIVISRRFSRTLFFVRQQMLEQEEQDRYLSQALIEKEMKIQGTELQKEHARLDAAISSLSLGCIVTDLQNNILYINPMLHEILQIPKITVTLSDIEQKFGGTVKFQWLLEESRTKKKITTMNNVVFKDNFLRIFITPILILENHNEVIGSVIAIEDVTTYKQLEQQQIEFVSMAAHELRTPMTIIKGYLSVFMNENRQKFNDEQKMFLDRITISVQRLGNLIENLLSVARIEKGTFALTFDHNVNYTEFISTIISQMKQYAADSKVTLEFIPPQESIVIPDFDTFRISEVFENLLRNAILYNKPQGHVTITVEKKENEIITHIQDTGVGIPKEAMAHLFSKFFRALVKFEHTSKGAGLGLYIAKAILEHHKGRIWAESKIGQGSIFHFSLPLTPIAMS